MSSITFLNKPRMSNHVVDQRTNERRLEVAEKLEDFLGTHSIFKEKDITVSFAEKGVSSLVCIIDTGNQKYVLKVPSNIEMAKQETLFLNKWKEVGVTVPNIFEQGVLGDHAYILMEYIDAENLRDHFKLNGLIREKVFVTMGEVLRQMHTAKAVSFGKPVGERGEFETFKSWFLGPDGYTRKAGDIQEFNLLGNEYGSIQKAVDILIQGTDTESVYCHYDFAPENIFATNPITVFDPVPMFNNPFMDLSRTIVIAVSRCGTSEVVSQLIEGYFKGEEYDKRLLHAAIFVQAYMKFPYWNKTAQSKRLEYVREYLLNNKNLFEI